MWQATVVEHHRLRWDIAVVRLEGDVVPFAAGQSVEVSIPQRPLVWRRLSPALPPSRDGKLEFHVRWVPAGWLSPAAVTETQPGDVWQIKDPKGEMRINESGRDVVMFAGGTGLAPLRALILDVSRRLNPPKVHLFLGGHTRRDFYAEDMLVLLSKQLDWLTVVPVIQNASSAPSDDEDPWYERTRVGIEFPPAQFLNASMAQVAAAHGAFRKQQVLVCGSPAMTRSTVEQLLRSGTPPANISFDPNQ